ncbi:hypothetical protein BN938_0764 [Mucinivorans hirudinis]|uniref:Uncharacterized protein n=1 Tax=Mucinivorans hirudinis TaxID=1433126 RepID=A0A060RAS9_9BACT|nr:hypothetical protein BN938_0764 [Mucinivorans hirudinis]
MVIKELLTCGNRASQGSFFIQYFTAQNTYPESSLWLVYGVDIE